MLDHLAASGRRPVACILIPHYEIRLEVLRNPVWEGLPLALTDLAGESRRRIVDHNAEAAAQGVRVGMHAREIAGLAPEVTLLTPDPLYYAAQSTSILGRLYEISPRIEAGQSGATYIDLHGLKRHYARPVDACQALLGLVDPVLRPRIGLSVSKFAALVAAHRAEVGQVRQLGGKNLQRKLAGCSIDLLPVEPKIKERLRRFDLHTLGDLAGLSSSALLAQFGTDGQRIWELARGEDHAPFIPTEPVEPLIERVALPEASALYPTLLSGVYQLIARLLARPELRGRGLRKLRLGLRLEDQRSVEQMIDLKGAIRDERRLMAILAHRLQQIQIEGPVDELLLEVLEESPIHARQQALTATRRLREREQMQEAVRELTSRYGRSPLYHVVEIERWSSIPERRWGLIPFVPSTRPDH